MATLPTYVVITPARNEAQFIELTIKSVIAQTVQPLKWVIVSDGSTDETDAIVEKYLPHNPWIELVQVPRRSERHFAGKVLAFNAGCEKIKTLAYEVIVSLDGDISIEADYFSFLLGKLAADPALGLVGTPFKESSNPTYDYRFASIEHVSGACQVFRRRCFEDVGGYAPVKGGNIDHIAVITARMKGWKTRTFVEKVCHHHRPMGTAQQSLLMSRFRNGAKDYAIGNHPLWEMFRSIYQMTKRPLLIGGVALALGYFWSAIRSAERPVSEELVRFYRQEQMQRLKGLMGRRLASPLGVQSASAHRPS
ncbi:MAG: glycosyltransferase family 2 protein [Terriglobales bacterium]